MQKLIRIGVIILTIGLFSGCSNKAGTSPADTTPPEIHLLGSNPMTLAVGERFTDPGAIVTDNVDANRTIKGSGSVDTTEAGTYTLIYTAKDAAGNEAKAVERTVTVIMPPDTTPPTFTSPASVSVPESQLDAITLKATDESTPITYAISGTDADSFNLNATTGAVTFKSAPDFESGKTTYTFTAEATDAANNSVTQSVTVTVSDMNCSEGDENNPDTIWHLGVVYCPVTSPYTHRVWLDRNLGAAKVCDKSIAEFADEAAYTADQQACFGDYYQWGRNADGHEKKESNTTDVLADNVDDVGHGKFITNDDSPYDWVVDGVDNNGSKRVANWLKTNGTSVCPVGYRVATLDELIAELFDANSAEIQKESSEKSDNDDDCRVNAYNTFLKLPSAGGRAYDSGTLMSQGVSGVLWAATADGSGASFVGFLDDVAGGRSDAGRTGCTSVRCLRDNP